MDFVQPYMCVLDLPNYTQMSYLLTKLLTSTYTPTKSFIGISF